MSEDPRKLEPEEQFLRMAVDECLENGIVSRSDIITRFSPSDIMDGFKGRPERRADLLAACTGMNHRGTAMSIPPEVAGHLLTIALEQEGTTTDQIFHSLTSEDLIRHHEGIKIWATLFASEWPDTESKEHRDAMVALVKLPIELGILTHLEVVKAIGLDEFVHDRVPHVKRAKIPEIAISIGENGGKPFRAETLWTLLPPDEPFWPLPVLRRVLTAVAYKFGWQEQPKSNLGAFPIMFAVNVDGPAPVVVSVGDQPAAVAPVTDQSSLAPSDSSGGAPDPAGVAAPEEGEYLELDADAPSGVHPDAAVAPPLPPPPSGLDDILAGLTGGPVAPANPFGHLGPASADGDGKAKPMFAPVGASAHPATTPAPAKLPVPGGHKPPTPPSPVKRCQLKVASAQEALLKAHGELEKAQKTRDRKFTAESDLAATAALAAEVAATEALKKANHELEEALKANQ